MPEALKQYRPPQPTLAEKKIRAAFFVYPTAFQSPGGGEILLLKTKQYLEREDVHVKLFDMWSDKLNQFDLLHIFGSVKDCLPIIQDAQKLGIKIVLSTICWYSWRAAWGIYSDPYQRFLSLERHAAKTFFPFFPSMRKTMMQLSDLLCPNSETEADQLKRYFQIPEEKIRVIPNGVDPRSEEHTSELQSQR